MKAMRFSQVLILAACCVAAQGQTFSSSTLKGAYFARHVQFTTDAKNTVTDARSIIGTLTFDGTGFYSFSGLQVTGGLVPVAFNITGLYSVSPGGIVTIANPQAQGQTISARYSSEAVIGASTEARGNTFDTFIAIPAPTTPNFSEANLDSSYYIVDFELTRGSTASVRDSFLTAAFNGAGGISAFNATGHIASSNNGDVNTQFVANSQYLVNSDGSGVLQFQLPNNTFAPDALLDGQPRRLFVSRSGNVFIAGNPAGHDLTIGVRTIAAPANNSSLSGRYWRAGLRVDVSGTAQNYNGSSTAIPSSQTLVSGKRLHASAANSTTATYTNVTEAPRFTIAQNGTFVEGSTTYGLGLGGAMLVGASFNRVTDYTGYEIQFGFAIPAVSGTGVFVNPQGVVNAASYVPAGDAISPGEFIAIYGTGLASASAVAPPPYPTSLGGVSVTINGIGAPIYAVSATQINCLVPYGAMPPGTTTANITVINNGIASSSVTVPIAATSPGVFSLDTTGTGDGAILHIDNTRVNLLNPAKKGETVQLFMTGLGAPATPIPDGQGATAANLVKASVQLSVNGVAATVSYAGMSSLPGLYQINFEVPAALTGTGQMPISIRTPEASHSQVVIAVQ